MEGTVHGGAVGDRSLPERVFGCGDLVAAVFVVRRPNLTRKIGPSDRAAQRIVGVVTGCESATADDSAAWQAACRTLNRLASFRLGIRGDFRRRASRDDVSAFVRRTWPKIDDVVGRADQLQIVFDNDQRMTGGD